MASVSARYGQDWTGKLLRGWVGEDRTWRGSKFGGIPKRAHLILPQLPGPEARRDGRPADRAADRGLGHGSRQHADRDLRLYPADGRRPGHHPGDRRFARRRGSASGSGPVGGLVARGDGDPRPRCRLRRAAAWPVGPAATRARRLVDPATRERLHLRSVRRPPRLPRRPGPSHRSSRRSPSSAASTSTPGSTQLLKDLHEIARRQNDTAAFTARVRELRTRYAKRPSLMERFDKAELPRLE